MVADLCHFVFPLFRGEGEKTKAKKNAILRLFDFVFTPRNNEITTKLREITK